MQSFNLVLKSFDRFIEEKQPHDLAVAVGLYKCMLQQLFIMLTSPGDTENSMALGMLDKIFYDADPVDKVSPRAKRASNIMFYSKLNPLNLL